MGWAARGGQSVGLGRARICRGDRLFRKRMQLAQALAEIRSKFAFGSLKVRVFPGAEGLLTAGDVAAQSAAR